MVAWYKHDIPAWMDSTEGLSDGAYRVHHVVCQLIYLNEGPIRLNEQGIAGRCNQHILAFRKNLNLLLTSGRLLLNPDQTLSQPRADLELTRISRNRVNAGLGGKAKAKSLKTINVDLATLENTSAHKTREEKTREEKKESTQPVGCTDPPIQTKKPEAKVYERGREILGAANGALITNLFNAKNRNVPETLSVLEKAAGADNPRKYVAGIIQRASTAQRELSVGDSIWRDNL